MRRYLAGLLLALAHLSVFAQTIPATSCPNGYFSRVSRGSGIYEVSGPHATRQAACSSLNPFSGALAEASVTVNTDTQCVWRRSFDGYTLGPEIRFVGGECVEEPECPSQNSSFFNGLEWSFEVPQGSTLSDLDQCAPAAPSQSSGPGCTIEYNGVISTGADGKTYFSGTSQATSATCNYSPAPTNGEVPKADYPPPPPETAKPPPAGTCPGEVNGELVFAPCSFGPSTETISVTKTRNNGTDTITDTITGSNNCTASNCTWNISSTSTSTSGGSTNGSQSGTVNADGSGDGDGDGTGEQGEPCGGPGQPVCRVKVDETGTPNGQGAFNGLNQQADGVTESIRNSVEGLKNGSIPSWSWTFQLPTGCTPLVLEAFAMSLDICKYQPMIHDLMSMVWIAATISFLVSLFIRTD